MKIPTSFYQNSDVVFLAHELIGKTIFTNIHNTLTGGIITETEAYAGIIDKASHAYNGLRTSRNEVMYKSGGVSYVYLCYGIHHLFNIVTGMEEIPHAILIRGIHPTIGWNYILDRRGNPSKFKNITNGPGNVSKALGINISHNSISLIGNTIWLESQGSEIHESDIEASKRIGIDYAEEDSELLFRFKLKKLFIESIDS